MIFTSNIFYCQNNSLEDGIIYLSDIIAEKKIGCNQCDDLAKIDSIYIKALNFYNGDVSEALLALTFSTLPFNKMPIKIPFIDYRLALRLPAVNDLLFNLKKKHLPSDIYFDSPNSDFGDKDKISHFFGNAFLSYNIQVINLSKFLGMFVEMFESSFKVSSGIDFRDLQSNYLGEFYGSSLRNNRNLLPSDFFKLYSLFYFSYN